MNFRPYVLAVQGPRNTIGTPPSPAASPQSISVLHPIARTCGLSAIPAVGHEDFFLYHPYDGTLEAVYVSSVPEVTLTEFEIQLVQKEGTEVRELTSPKSLDRLSASGTEIPSSAKIGEGPVFVRIKSPSVSVTVLVTIHVMTSEIK